MPTPDDKAPPPRVWPTEEEVKRDFDKLCDELLVPSRRMWPTDEEARRDFEETLCHQDRERLGAKGPDHPPQTAPASISDDRREAVSPPTQSGFAVKVVVSGSVVEVSQIVRGEMRNILTAAINSEVIADRGRVWAWAEEFVASVTVSPKPLARHADRPERLAKANEVEWSTEWPTEPGWYPTRGAGGPWGNRFGVAEAVTVDTVDGPIIVHRLDGRHLSPSHHEGRLWGPRIPEPGDGHK